MTEIQCELIKKTQPSFTLHCFDATVTLRFDLIHQNWCRGVKLNEVITVDTAHSPCKKAIVKISAMSKSTSIISITHQSQTYFLYLILPMYVPNIQSLNFFRQEVTPKNATGSFTF